jgi:Na+/H+ antiporter NhaA
MRMPRSEAILPATATAAWIEAGAAGGAEWCFCVGLEARREFDVGELRDRRRLALPLAAGVGGMVVPVAIYLAANAGRPSAYGWGIARSTDTAFAPHGSGRTSTRPT